MVDILNSVLETEIPKDVEEEVVMMAQHSEDKSGQLEMFSAIKILFLPFLAHKLFRSPCETLGCFFLIDTVAFFAFLSALRTQLLCGAFSYRMRSL